VLTWHGRRVAADVEERGGGGGWAPHSAWYGGGSGSGGVGGDGGDGIAA